MPNYIKIIVASIIQNIQDIVRIIQDQSNETIPLVKTFQFFSSHSNIQFTQNLSDQLNEALARANLYSYTADVNVFLGLHSSQDIVSTSHITGNTLTVIISLPYSVSVLEDDVEAVGMLRDAIKIVEDATIVLRVIPGGANNTYVAFTKSTPIGVAVETLRSTFPPRSKISLSSHKASKGA